MHTGACHHALGSHSEAVRDYESAFSVTSKDLGEDTRSRQFLTFYQREMALYTRSNEDRLVEDYSLDHDLHPVFKACPSSSNFLATQGLYFVTCCSLVLCVRSSWVEVLLDM